MGTKPSGGNLDPKIQSVQALSGTAEYLADLVRNYVERTRKKNSDEKETASRIKPITSEESSSLNSPMYITGDTIKSGNTYYLPEYIEMRGRTVGGRNRGDYDTINTEGAVITLLNELRDYENADRNFENYVGYDSSGRLKVGRYEDFGKGDKMSGTFMNRVKGATGSVKRSEKNGTRFQPIVNVEGEKTHGSLNLLTEKDGSTNTFGSVTGGRILVYPRGAENAQPILVSGSIDDVSNKIEEIKKKYKVDALDVYTMDNGTFNTGLRTFNRELRDYDLKKYDNRNSGGGNFIYLKDNNSATPTKPVVSKPVKNKKIKIIKHID
jgi:hypothetical protein